MEIEDVTRGVTGHASVKGQFDKYGKQYMYLYGVNICNMTTLTGQLSRQIISLCYKRGSETWSFDEQDLYHKRRYSVEECLTCYLCP